MATTLLLKGHFPGNLGDYFDVIDGDTDCSSNKIVHYCSLFFCQAPAVTLINEVGPSNFGHIGSYLCDYYTPDGGTFREYGSLIEFITVADYFQSGNLALLTCRASWSREICLLPVQWPPLLFVGLSSCPP